VLDCVIPVNIAIATYLLQSSYHADQSDIDAWTTRMATICSPEKMRSGMTLYSLHFNRAGIVCLAMGAQMGQFFEWIFFVNRNNLNSSQWIWNQTSPLKTIARIIITLCFIFVCDAPALIFDKSISMETETGLIWHFFIVGCLPFFLVGFGVFGFLRALF
jgi:hypothetical protein